MITNSRIVACGGAVAAVTIAVALCLYGTGADGWLHATRWTARWALIPFLLTFTATVLLRHVRGGALRDLLRHRRGLGLAFALAHGIHFATFVTFFAVSGERPAVATVIGGGLAYLFILAMALTSTDAMRRALGRAWPHLHKWGMRYVFLIFVNSYVGRIAEGGARVPEGIVGASLLAIALALKLGVRRRI